MPAGDDESAGRRDPPRVDYGQLFQALAEPAFLIDYTSGAIVDASDAAAHMLHYTRAELLQMTVADLHPFEMDRFEAFIARVKAEGEARARGLTCRCREGQFIPAEISARLVEVPNGTYVLAVVRDLGREPAPAVSESVTLAEYHELQERLARVEYILDYAPEMVLWITPAGRLMYANQTAAQALGWRRSELQRMYIWDVDSDAEEGRFPSHVEHIRDLAQLCFQRRMRCADGSTFPVTVTTQYLRHGDDELIISFSRDISEEVAARNEARRYLGELAHVSRQATMSEMASAVSHEINQPLTTILLRCSACMRILEREQLDLEGLRTSMESVRSNAEHISDVVGRLRSYMKGGEPTRERVSGGALLGECTTLLRAEARHCGVDLRVDWSDDIPDVDVDSILVQQVILNLARNAMEAVRDSQGERCVSINGCRDADGSLRVAVTDTGPGIADDVAEHVFEPFFSTKGSGMGIGLSLCRSIMDSHHGDLVLQETGPGGTTFVATLPAANESSPVEQQA